MKPILLTIVVLIINCQPAFSQGEQLFDDTYLHEIHFSRMDTTLLNGSRVYQMVDMVFDGSTVDSIGIKEKGNISNLVPNLKVPLKIKTNKYVSGKEFDSIKEFTLHNNYQDPSMMREKITYDIVRQMGLFALRTAYARVYINGVYWGLYTIVEGKDEMFKQRFDNRDADAIESLDLGNMCYISNNPDDYNFDIVGLPYYRLENGNASTAFPRFATMVDKANNTPDSQYLDVVSNYLNLEHFFIYQAINVYLVNMDSYIAFGGNQIYMYDADEDRFQVIPWDFNASLGLWNTNNFSPQSYPVIPSSISSGCIASRMNTLEELRSYYLDAICSLHDISDPEKMNNVIDAWKSQIRQAVYDDNRMTFSNQDFDQSLETGYFRYNNDNIPALKTFFTDRFDVIAQGLANIDYSCNVSISVEEDEAPVFYHLGQNFPNPFDSSTEIAYTIHEPGWVNLKVFDVLGIEIHELVNEQRAPGTYKVIQNASSLSSGVYFYQLRVNNFISTKKMIIVN